MFDEIFTAIKNVADESARKKRESLKIARVLLTLDCNLSCEYCCNRTMPDLLATFKPLLSSHIESSLSKFDAINFSGGEPLLRVNFLQDLCDRFKDKSIRIYTNGILLNSRIFKLLECDRYEIGLHKTEQLSEHVVSLIINHPGRFRISVNENNRHFTLNNNSLESLGCEINYWRMNECENDDDGRFLIVG